MKVKVLWEYLYTHWPHDSSSSSTVLSLSFSLLLYCFKWAQDPLNLVEIKNPFGFFKPTPRLMLSGFTNFYFEKMLSVSAWTRYNIHPSPLPHSRRAVCICLIRVNLYSHWSHPNITPLCIDCFIFWALWSVVLYTQLSNSSFLFSYPILHTPSE